MSALWSPSGIALVLSTLVLLAALFKLPPGQHYPPWLRLTYALSGASGVITSGTSFYGISGSLGQSLNFAAIVLMVVALFTMFRSPLTR